VYFTNFAALLQKEDGYWAAVRRHIRSKNSMDKKVEKRQKGSVF